MQLSDNKTKFYIFCIVTTSFIYITETIIPKPVPWMRLGLSNIIFMLIITKKNIFLKDLLLILLLRNILSSIIIGTFLTPIFFISLCSSVISLSFTYYFIKLFLGKLSFVGISINSAIINICCQITIGSLIFFNSLVLLNLLIYFMAYSFLSGIITGYITNKVYSILKDRKNIIVN